MGGSSWTPGALSRAAVLLSNSHGSPSLSLLSSLTPVSWTGCLGPLHSPCSRKCLARQVKKLRPLYAELIWHSSHLCLFSPHYWQGCNSSLCGQQRGTGLTTPIILFTFPPVLHSRAPTGFFLSMHSQPCSTAYLLGQPIIQVRSPLPSTSRDGGAPQGHRGFLQPRLRDQAPSKSQACVWYDWFLSDSDPDPTVVAHFEELFLEAGGVRCWSAERLVSPLLLASCFPEYREWCQVKSEVDPDGLLGSGYVQGTLTLDKK